MVETMVEKKPWRREIRVAVFGGAAALLAAIGIGAYASSENSQNDSVAALETKVKELDQQLSDAKTQSIDTTQVEIAVYERAKQSAASFSMRLNQPDNRVLDMYVLNGFIEAKQSDGTYEPIYINPILLSTQPNGPTYSDPNFLQGGWLGEKGTDQNGNFAILPFPFKSTYRFTSFDPESPILGNTGVLSVVINGGETKADIDLIAFDITNNQTLVNPDGSAVHPGSYTGIK
jgi:hypothetical protein